MSMRTKDSRQRGAALTRIASTMLVEAGAGTGKTSIMAGRIVRLLASGVEPSRIAAVTFTELAASELQDRVRRFAAVVATGGKLPPDIAGAFPGGVSAEEASSVATALSSLQEMTFGTIHSFCQRLLQPYPVEARMDPGARVLDATEASLLFTDTFEAWLRERLDVEDTGDDVVAHYAVALGRAAESDLEEIARAIYANPSASDSGVSLDRRLATRFVEAVDSYALWSKGLGFGHEDHDVYVARLVLLADRVRDLMRTGEAEACVGIASLVTPLMTSSGTFRKMKMKGKWVAAGGKEAGTAADEAAVARYTECAGLFGAMLTGDVFNLFVFFEILLIASYGLMIHGGGRMRLRGGVQYVIYNLAGSTLFLFALGTVYGVLGTLNMADMAVRAAELPAGDWALLRVAAALLLLVFVLKGALLPLHFWLPNTYALAPAPVAALFAIMTKVGAYAVIRVYTLVFPPELEATGSMASDAIIPAALVTLVVGMVGVLAGGTVARVVAFAAIGSMGTLFLAIGAFTPQATAAALYYLIHSTLAAGVLFLIVDQIRARRGNTALVALPPMAQNGLIAALFFGGAIAMAGMPPLSGFVGKLLVMDALRDHALWVWIWGAILVTSLIAVVGFARAGSTLFWKAHDATTQDTPPEAEARVNVISEHVHPGAAVASIGAMLGLIIALTVLAGPVMRHAEAAAEQLHERQAYIVAVLGADAVLDPLTGAPMVEEDAAAPEAEPETDEEEG